ncbi:AMP-binding protein [Tatumella sp. UBA2305]|uniref:AMP-binding protein n=1 Tax=Tatumella sp. UBA2305 TaxID=1947647 RepID=UPI0025D5E80E|nr:AMP-binding protein [Tatumella sp. UBA2305]
MDSKIAISYTESLSLRYWLDNSRDPDTIVAWDNTGEISLNQLRSDVVSLYQQLSRHTELRWVVCIQDHYLFIVGLLALLHAGKKPVLAGHQRQALLLEQMDHFDGVLSHLPIELPKKTLMVEHQPCQLSDVILPEISPHTQIDLFTSGSTGVPKKVPKTVEIMDAEAQLLATKFTGRLHQSWLVSSVIPLHLYGLSFGIWLPMSLGIPVFRQQLTYAEQLSALPEGRHFSFISSPAFLKRIDSDLRVPKLSFLLSAGGELAWHYQQKITQWCGLSIDEIYGSSETGVIAHRRCSEEFTPWHLLPGVSLSTSAGVSRIRSPLLNNETPHVSDDKFQSIDERQFHLLGRVGRVVKIEEKRISLDEIEQRILKLDGVTDAAVVTISRGARIRIGALLVLNSTSADEQSARPREFENRWRLHLKDYLEPIAIPRYWKVVGAIPVNSMNKRVYPELQELFFDTH